MTAGWQPGAAPRGVLPREALLGRDEDEALVEQHCIEQRLVSLLGAGGTGKTTLAAAVAPQAAAGVRATACWVDLQPVPPGGEVAPVIGEAIGVSVDGAEDPTAKLARRLTERALLLVLDNCEHVADDVAAVLEVLLPACPGLRVLATSRVVLGVPGEEVVRLAPLAIPPSEAGTSPDVLRDHAAPALFLQRAGLDPFELDADARGAVVRICRQLDGLPLAIELAAARSPTLSPTAIEAALTDRFRVLSSRRRGGSDRQRTLEASIGWSHDLLRPDEQRLLRSLAVFPAGFDLAAAAVVGADGDDLAALDLLTDLVDRSLVAIQEGDSGRRYRLLESVRAFADQQLREHDELAAARDRHLAAVRRRLRGLQLSDDHEGLVLRGDPWLAEEFDDVRTAADWAVATGRPGEAVDLWWAVHVWAYSHARPAGPRGAVLAIDPEDLDDDRRLRRDVLAIAGPSISAVGDLTTGRRLVDELWTDGAPDPEVPLTAHLARLWLLSTRMFALEGDPEELATAARELVAVEAEHPTWGDLVRVTTGVVAGRALDLSSHPDEAHELLSAVVPMAERVASPTLLAYTRGMLATSAAKMARPDAIDHLLATLDALPPGWHHQRLGVMSTSGVAVMLATGDVEWFRGLVEPFRADAGGPGTGSWLHLQAIDVTIALADGHDDVALDIIDRILGQASRRSPMDHFRLRETRARALARLGRVEEARAITEDLGASPVVVQDAFLFGVAATTHTEVLLRDGEPSTALAHAAGVVPVLLDRKQHVLVPWLAAVVAWVLAEAGRLEAAARTLGRIDQHLAEREAVLPSESARHVEQWESAARDELGDDAFEAAVAAGRDPTWAEWAASLDDSSGVRDDDRPPTGWAALTPAEMDVARRAAQGLSTAEVAEALFVSPNTVKTHLKHIYSKLDVHSRVELAAAVDEHDERG